MDAWSHHEALFKDLYQDQRKTLEEVKAIMERDYGFTSHPLSVYETKLKAMGMRKKLKKGDWEHIYLYARWHGLERYEVYLNGTKLPWEKVWKEIRRSGVTRTMTAGKGARNLDRHTLAGSKLAMAGEVCLPPGVSVVPRQGVSCIRIDDPSDPHGRPCTDSSSTAMELRQNRTKTHTSGKGTESDAMVVAHRPISRKSSHVFEHSSFIKRKLEAVPWQAFRILALGALNPGLDARALTATDDSSFALMWNDGFFGTQRGHLVRISDSHFPGRWSLDQYVDEHVPLSNDFHAYQRLAALTYIVSNGLYDSNHPAPVFNQLGTVLHVLPHAARSKIFRSDTLSLRAIWDRLIQHVLGHGGLSESKFDPEAISFIISAAIGIHPEWVRGDEDKILYIAASTGNRDLVSTLLSVHGARPIYCDRITPPLMLNDRRRDQTAISAAFGRGSLDIVQLLISSYDMNDTCIKTKQYNDRYFPRQQTTDDIDHHIGDDLRNDVPFGHTTKDVLVSNFVFFLSFALTSLNAKAPVSAKSHTSDFHGNTANLLRLLDLFLEAGADVDTPFPSELCPVDYLGCLSPQCEAHKWLPSCLDVAFYLYEPFFQRMRTRSRYDSEIFLTRSGAIEAAVHGELSLLNYLNERTSYSGIEKQQYLDIILLELFCIGNLNKCHKSGVSVRSSAEIARMLLDMGITGTSSCYGQSTEIYLLQICIDNAKTHGLTGDLVSLMNHLVSQTAYPIQFMLSRCVEVNGIELLNFICGTAKLANTDFTSIGGHALLRASRLHNYEAIRWLLDLGTDINTEILTPYGPHAATVLGYSLCDLAGGHSTPQTLPMCQYLREQGAKPASHPSDGRFYKLLRFIAGQRHTKGILNLFGFLGNYQEELRQVTPPQWQSLLDLAMQRAYSYEPEDLLEFAMKRAYLYEPEDMIWLQDVIPRQCAPPAELSLSKLILGNGDQNLVQHILRSGADINKWDSKHTPLYAAIEKKNFDLAHQLLELGADSTPVDQTPETYRTALSIACGLTSCSKEQHVQKRDLILALLERGEDVNGKLPSDPPGEMKRACRPLVEATYIGDIETVALLLEHHADPNLPATEGGLRTPLDVAVLYGRLDIANLLLTVGGLSARPGLTGYDGAIQLATQRGYGAVSKLLRQHIYDMNKHFTSALNGRQLRDSHRALVACHRRNVDKLQVARHVSENTTPSI